VACHHSVIDKTSELFRIKSIEFGAEVMPQIHKN